MLELRDYQKECLESIDRHGKGRWLVCLATGMGKTVVFTSIPNNFGKTLVLAHREELIHQPVKYYNCPVGLEQAKHTSNGEEVVIASVQSLVRRLGRFNAEHFGRIIIDECFPQNVKIKTPNGEKELHKLRHGDIVASYNHATGALENKRVLNLFKSVPKEMCKIIFSNGQEVFCTSGHPFYVKNRGDYVEAKRISRNDIVLSCLQKGSAKGKEKQKQGNNVQKARKNILLGRMHKKGNVPTFIGNYGKNKQDICKRTYEEKQSYAKPCFKGKNVFTLERNRALSKGSLWKWKRINSTTTTYAFSFKRFRALCRISHSYKNRKREWVSYLLQGRYCPTSISVGYRNRRKFPRFVEQERRRQEKRHSFTELRVESVTIQKQGSEHEFRNMCPDGYVYNIEVEDNNNYFADGILVHNCHHAVSPTYKKIIEHFSGVKQLLGVTATPARGDKVGLEKIFDKIIFERGLRWGIENNYLCDIECLKVGINYDLSSVRLKGGDYAVGELEEEMAETSEEIAAVYKKHAKGQTIIFAVSVKHAHDIADAIGSDAVAIDATTKNRADIFKNPPPCIVNCMVLTEGFDMPSIQTVIMARPTKNKSLYQQCVGRGTRLYNGKEKLRLIDCVGVSDIDMCTAPTLLGIDISSMPKERKEKLQSENLADLENLVQINSDTVESWMINTKIVDLWAKSERYNTHDINFFKLATGELLVLNYRIKPQDQLGTGMQEKIDFLFEHLRQNHQNEKHIWDKNIAKSWGKYPASEKQMEHIRRIYPDMGMITKLEASNILTRMWGVKNKKVVDVEI